MLQYLYAAVCAVVYGYLRSCRGYWIVGAQDYNKAPWYKNVKLDASSLFFLTDSLESSLNIMNNKKGFKNSKM